MARKSVNMQSRYKRPHIPLIAGAFERYSRDYGLIVRFLSGARSTPRFHCRLS
jgi:hypothetical protein